MGIQAWLCRREGAGLEMEGMCKPQASAPSVPSTGWPEGSSSNAHWRAGGGFSHGPCTGQAHLCFFIPLPGRVLPRYPCGFPPTFCRSLLKGHVNRLLKWQRASLPTPALSDFLLCFISRQHFLLSDIYCSLAALSPPRSM